MRQFTTPLDTLRIDGHDLSGADVYVTYSNKRRSTILTLDSPTVTTDSTGSTIEVHFTQAQSGMFQYGEEVATQVNWIEAGERYATDIVTRFWKENLIKEVIE